MLLALGLALCVAGVGLLRLAWHQPLRSTGLNGAGWGALGMGVVLAGQAEGAWGMAVAAMAAMLAASGLLAAAALASPARRAQAERIRIDRKPGTADELAIGRRTAIFLLVVPGAFAAAFLIALAAFVLARTAGWTEANSIPLIFFLFPLAWTGLVLVLMFQAGLRRSLAQLAAIAAGAGAIAWVFA